MSRRIYPTGLCSHQWNPETQWGPYHWPSPKPERTLVHKMEAAFELLKDVTVEVVPPPARTGQHG